MVSKIRTGLVNGGGNNSVEVRNDGSVASLIVNAKTPSSTSPSVWADVNANTKSIVFYKNDGSGWVSVGNVKIA